MKLSTIKPYLIAYDIQSDRLRNKIGKKILEFGINRIQYSVYLGSITPTQFQQLKQSIQAIFNSEKQPSDSIIFIPIPAQQLRLTNILGTLDIDIDYILGERHTLII